MIHHMKQWFTVCTFILLKVEGLKQLKIETWTPCGHHEPAWEGALAGQEIAMTFLRLPRGYADVMWAHGRHITWPGAHAAAEDLHGQTTSKRGSYVASLHPHFSCITPFDSPSFFLLNPLHFSLQVSSLTSCNFDWAFYFELHCGFHRFSSVYHFEAPTLSLI